MIINGKTVEECTVVGGVFALVGTYGIPLEVVLQYAKSKNIVVDWQAYVHDAMKDGAKLRSIRGKVLAAVGEVYGPKYTKGFTERFDTFFDFNWYDK